MEETALRTVPMSTDQSHSVPQPLVGVFGVKGLTNGHLGMWAAGPRIKTPTLHLLCDGLYHCSTGDRGTLLRMDLTMNERHEGSSLGCSERDIFTGSETEEVLHVDYPS